MEWKAGDEVEFSGCGFVRKSAIVVDTYPELVLLRVGEDWHYLAALGEITPAKTSAGAVSP